LELVELVFVKMEMEMLGLVQHLQQLPQLVVDLVDQEQIMEILEETADLAAVAAEALTTDLVETEIPHL
tara:strand:- start:96 stop:302 length:207 start_codon:yes stop_codon:yes gene_type:complete